MREDYSFTEESSAFCAADIKNITAFGNQWQTDIILRAGKRIGKSGTVEIKRDMVSLADGMELVQFFCCVKCAILCGM